jgi:ATP-dependent helicase HrpB
MQPLPIDASLEEITAVLGRSTAVIVEAAPGAGKTTRIPVALWRAGVAGDRQVVVLQPRRVAARAAARRVAAESRWRLGEEVGYQVRFDRRWSDRTKILFVTEGIFLAMLQSDPFLDQVGVVVFDEFHERSLDADMCLAMTRRVQTEVRPDLLMVVMSATLDPGPVAAFLGGCTTLSVKVPCHPVEIEHVRRSVDGDPARAAAGAAAGVLERAAGDVLVFLPGVAWIRRCARALEALAARHHLRVVELHGSLDAEAQDRALQPADRTRVVLATNIAETSLTIDGVRAVVDSGLARVLRHDTGSGINRLQTGRISRASAAQRAGRAGRQGPGLCVRLWTEAEHAGLRDVETPEVRRLELSGAVLQLLAWGETDVGAFPWFEPPPERALARAFELLRQLGAVDASGLSEDGRAMAALPLHPRLARLVVEGWRRGVLEPASWAAAALSDGLRAARGTVDLGALALDPGARSSRLRRIQDDLVSRLESRLGPAGRTPDARRRAFALSALTAFPDRLARRRGRDDERAVMVGGQGLRLEDHGHLGPHELLVAVKLQGGDRRQGAEARVSCAIPVEHEWLPEDRRSTTTDVELDGESGRVRAIRRTRWRDLIVSERAGAPADPTLAAAVLARAAAEDPERTLGLDREPARSLLARLRSLAEWRPELGLPTFPRDEINELLPGLCHGKRSLAALARLPIADILAGLLTPDQRAALEREAPERLRVPSGSRLRLAYEPGRAPVLAVRIQELFGLDRTPTVAGGRVRVMLHLLAPNGRPQQVTDDLASFWANTYAQVRSELRGRYPRHHWPENPLSAQPTSRTRPHSR